MITTFPILSDMEKMDSPSQRGIIALQQFYGNRKSLRWVVFLVIAALSTLYLTGQGYTPAPGQQRASKVKARYLSPKQLLERPISKDLQTIPKLFHQSWSSTELPAKFERWSATCRRAHPDW